VVQASLGPRRRPRCPATVRVTLTLPIMMIDPPAGCCCITALAACATCSGAIRFSSMTLAWNRGDAVAAATGGEPPALADHDVPAAEQVRAGLDQLPRLLRVLTSAAGKRGSPAAAAGGDAGSLRAQTMTCSAGAKETPEAMPAPMPLDASRSRSRGGRKGRENGWSTGCMAPC